MRILADKHCVICRSSVCELRQVEASLRDTKSGASRLAFFTDALCIGGLPKLRS
jgi:hypothetical protein